MVEAAKELAKPYYEEWLELNLDIQDYMKRIIQKPYSNETLEVYLERIASEMKRKKGRRSSKIRSLRSFTAYLREQLSQEERGLIEEIFPEEMRVDQHTGKISRIAPATAYPIDIHLVAQILQGLARELLEGRPNAQLVAAEAHHLGLSALTSMMGSSQAQYADWAILAKFRHVCEFVLIPDNDNPGHKYMEAVAQEVQKACPSAKLTVCKLSIENKGDDFVDWILAHSKCPPEWDGFGPIDEPHSEYLRIAFEDHVNSNSLDAFKYFEKNVDGPPAFNSPPEAIKELLSEVLPCPTLTLPQELTDWIQGNAKQMQIAEDYFVASLFVYLGSLIGMIKMSTTPMRIFIVVTLTIIEHPT